MRHRNVVQYGWQLSTQVTESWRGKGSFIFAYQILIKATVLVKFPSDCDGGAAKVLLEFVVKAEVADGVVQDVQFPSFP